MSIYRITIVALMILFLAACRSAPNPVYVGPWQYSDLRLLAAADSPDPSSDLIAVYTRSRGIEEQVRLDFLDLADQPACDLYLAFDTQPGGTTWLPFNTHAAFEWDTLVVIPANGPIKTFSSPTSGRADSLAHLPLRENTAIRIVRDPLQDMLVVSLNRLSLGVTPAGYRLQVFITLAGSTALVDSLGPVRSDGLPPQPAQVLFAFWNSLPAYNPAQALRRWDGAHTGPLGGRHGLANLLRAARGSGTPIVLLDLKSPTDLSALDYVGGLALVKDMVASDLLMLPETLPMPSAQLPLPEWARSRLMVEDRQEGIEFGLPASPFLYASPDQNPLINPARVIFTPVPTDQSGLQPVRVGRWLDQLVIPILQTKYTTDGTQQATPDGPSLEVRLALVQAALAGQASGSPKAAPILVLGGDLPSTTWGNPLIARVTFHYFAVHPWIRELFASDLLALSPSPEARPPSFSPAGDSPFLGELNASPHNNLTIAAWQAYLALLAPLSPSPQGLENLRASYLGQLEPILSAARWAEKPTPLATCAADLDQDGQAECILASKDFFAVFEPENGALIYLFTLTGNGPHQIIGPSSQFLTGASQPTDWDLSGGLSADPEVIPGAFAGPGENYQALIENGSLTFTSPDGLTKSYRLTPNNLQLEVRGASPSQFRLPLALDPWVRFSSGWTDCYHGQVIPQGWSWEILPCSQGSGTRTAPSQTSLRPLHVEIRSSSAISAHAFTDSLPYLSIPEDPNRDYPAGHFLPFPMAEVDFSSPGDFSVEIQVTP